MLKACERQAKSKLKASEELDLWQCRVGTRAPSIPKGKGKKHKGTRAPSLPKGKLKAKGAVTQGTRVEEPGGPAHRSFSQKK